MASDMVANVRFNVAKTLTIIGPKLNSSVMTAQIKPVLSKLSYFDFLTDLLLIFPPWKEMNKQMTETG